jgi:NADPH:quinone reductase-like Zn-dependent oxidoreductase
MSILPTTMRAAVLLGNGGPEMLVIDAEYPVPKPGSGEALISVSACGVNNTDINTRVGWYSRSVTAGTSSAGFGESRTDDATWGQGGLNFPRIQGADICGRVVAVGSGEDESMIGTRVMVDPWIRDVADPSDRSLAGYLGSERDGGFAEYCVAPLSNIHPIQSSFTDVELATFACSWSTAEHMLHRVDLRAGQSIAVPGASGGVGSALVQLAKRRGATVVAIAGSAKLDDVRALGADHLIARERDGLVDAAVAANGGPFDVVADIVGGDNFLPWLEALRRGGRYVTSGAIAGPVVGLDLRTLYLNDLELYGATVYEPAIFESLVRYIERGEVHPIVAGTYPLEQIAEAQAAFVEKRHTGNLVITLPPAPN